MRSLFGVLIVLNALACSRAVHWTPLKVSDTGDIEITCDATKGNKGLLNYQGEVYVHIGLVTDVSETPEIWSYSKFEWGSTEEEARAEKIAPNKWRYSIKNIRKFFDVPDDEQIISISILFRSGDCGSDCKVFRNEDGSDFFIPVEDKERPLDRQFQ